MRAISSITYDLLVEIVKGTYNKSVKERTRIDKNALMLFFRYKDKLTVSKINDKDVLLFQEKRVSVKVDFQKMVKQNKKSMKGGGARSVAYKMKGTFEGVSEREVRKVLNKSETHGQLHGSFTNKPPLKFVQSDYVFERVQIDLMRMSDVEWKGEKFKYVLTTVDVFSRYIFCRPLQNKSAKCVAKALKNVFDEHGWPKIVQCDNGKEFFGTVDIMLKKHYVKVIRSRAYHPQSQGKVERQNRIVRKKTQHELYTRSKHGYNWAESLPEVVNSINSQPKEVLSYQTPFAVYFGRGYGKTADEIRQKTRQASIECNKRTHTRHMRKSQCSVYENGARVLVRYPFGKRVPYKRHILKGIVVRKNREFSRYKVRYRKPDETLKTEWVPVENITSRTLQEEKQRRKHAFDLFQRIEKRRKHRERFYITMDNSIDEFSLAKAISEEEFQKFSQQSSLSDNETTNASKTFACYDNIIIADDPHEASNCQFVSISDQIRKIGIYRTGMQLRHMAISHIEKFKTHYQNFVVGSINRYLTNMAYETTFGDNVTLVAIARELNCQFVVIKSEGQSYHRFVSNTGIFAHDLPTFTLGFYPEIHYVSVEVMNPSTLRDIITSCQLDEEVGDENMENKDKAVNDENEHADDDEEQENIVGFYDKGTVAGNDKAVYSDDDNALTYDVGDDDDAHTDDVGNDDNALTENVTENDEAGYSNDDDDLIDAFDDDDDGDDGDDRDDHDSDSDDEEQENKVGFHEKGTITENDKAGYSDDDNHLIDVGDDDNDDSSDSDDDDAADAAADDDDDDDDGGSFDQNRDRVVGDFDEMSENESLNENEDNNGNNRDHMQVGVNERRVIVEESDANVPQESIPTLPNLVIHRILNFAIKMSPLMRYTLQRVCPEFAEIVRMIGYPRVYLNSINPLPREVSCARLNRMYGGCSGLILEIRKVLSEVGGRWYRAWLTLQHVGLGWYLIVDVRWRR